MARAEDGYTLIELLVVLAIIGLVTLAFPAILSAARPVFASQAAARSMAHEIGAARQIAITENLNTRVLLDSAADSFVTMPGGAMHRLPKDIRFKSASNEIDFFPDGSSSGGMVLVGEAGHQHRIAVHWLSGRVSLDE